MYVCIIHVYIYVISGSESRPEEGAHGIPPLIVDVTGHREAVLSEDAVELPLGHRLIVGLGVRRVAHRHLEAASSVPQLLMLLSLPVDHEVHSGHASPNRAHAAAPSSVSQEQQCKPRRPFYNR